MTSNAHASTSSPSLPTTPLVDGSSASGSVAPLPSVDPDVFRTYLLQLLPPVLGATIDELESTLFDEEFDERTVKFASEGGGAVYIVKTRITSEGRARRCPKSIRVY